MTVYITQEMRGRNLSDATSFGDLEILIPAEQQAGYSTDSIVDTITRKLQDYTGSDYILLAGDPAIIAITAAIAAKQGNGSFRMLKWDRQEEKYYPLAVKIFTDELGGSYPYRG